MPGSVIEASRALFHQVALPVLQREFPVETSHAAFGLFGYGSEAYGYDDELSRDHHFGLRIDGLLPDEMLGQAPAMREAVAGRLPTSFQGWSLREGHLKGAGLSLDGFGAMLNRTIGLPRAPATLLEWMSIPEEEIAHLTNGEVWHDPTGRFTELRAAFANHYPEPIRLRRIAHWCRFYSGMGTYALKRAILRRDDLYASIAFGKAVRLGAQLAFLIERRFFPYDKWLLRAMSDLPRLGEPVSKLLTYVCKCDLTWEKKLGKLDALSVLLDQAMVGDGLIRPHPRFEGSPTSGLRLLEHAYAELIQKAPDDLKCVWPQWDQVFLETFHAGYVDGLDLEEWDRILGLCEAT